MCVRFAVGLCCEGNVLIKFVSTQYVMGGRKVRNYRIGFTVCVVCTLWAVDEQKD